MADVHPKQNKNPKDIVQDFLDRQGEATMSGDVEETLKWCDIPCTMESIDGSIVASDMTQMRAICEGFISTLRQKRLTHLVRICLEASFQDADTIWGTYETRYIDAENTLPEDPYVAFVILKQIEDRWKINTLRLAVGSNSPANTTLKNTKPPTAE